MRGTAATGWTLLIVALLAGVLIAIGLYAWDGAARTAEAALRPAPVSPLAVNSQPSSLPLAAPSPAAGVPTVASAPLPSGDAAAGQRIVAAQCNSCHPSANAGIGPALYGPQFIERYPDDAQLVAVIRQGKGGMPAFPVDQLSDQDLANTMAYIRGLGSGAIAAEPTPTPRPRQRGG
jgi:mono/diheme cytochrome c family protein